MVTRSDRWDMIIELHNHWSYLEDIPSILGWEYLSCVDVKLHLLKHKICPRSKHKITIESTQQLHWLSHTHIRKLFQDYTLDEIYYWSWCYWEFIPMEFYVIQEIEKPLTNNDNSLI